MTYPPGSKLLSQYYGARISYPGGGGGRKGNKVQGLEKRRPLKHLYFSSFSVYVYKIKSLYSEEKPRTCYESKCIEFGSGFKRKLSFKKYIFEL